MKTLEDLRALKAKMPLRAVNNYWFVAKAAVFETLAKNKMHASADHVFHQLQRFANLQAKKG
jgi:hypothetical protein